MVSTDILRQVDIFKGLNREEIEAVAEVTTEWDCAKGQTIFKEGDKSEVLYVIAEGEVAAVISTGLLVNHTVATFGGGDVFGELAFIDRHPRTATIKCTREATLISFSREEFRRLGKEHHNLQKVILKNIAQLIAGRLRKANEMLKELSGRDRTLAAYMPHQFIV